MKSMHRQIYLKNLPIKKCNSIKLQSIKMIMIIIVAIFVIALLNNMSFVVIKTMNLDLRKIISCKMTNKINSDILKTIRIQLNLEKESESELVSTHPLENFCKYAILHPWDKSLRNYMKDLSNTTCDQVLPDIIKFQNGKISVDQEKAIKELNFHVTCKYRPIGGALLPTRTTPIAVGGWVIITDNEIDVPYEQIEVQCFKKSGNNSLLVYKFALAHVVPKINKTFVQNTEDRLSLSILEMDSVSRNAFRRHMPLSFEYLTKQLNAFDMQGFMKVADNTLPNLLPILTGLQYLNLSDEMPSDFPLDKAVDLETMPSLWKEYRDKGCATLLNDDPVHYTRGFLQYPMPHFNGFHSPPTDYYFRPFYVFNRRYPAEGYPFKNVSKLCMGNKFSFDYQLELHEQMSMLYSNKCHFTFTSIAELAHDDCNNLKLMDLKLKQLVQRLHHSNVLNKTILIIMGDHGQRIHLIQREYIARIEERMPMFTILFPDWFRKKYPKIMNNLWLNQNRLISNFDIYQILKDVSDGNFDGNRIDPKFPRQSKGLSLFHNFISQNRTCHEANVPENHCACLIPHKSILPDDAINVQSYKLIKNYMQSTLEKFAECQKLEDIKIVNITRWTMNQMVQHGVRIMDTDQLKLLETFIEGNVEYFEVEYIMLPMNINVLIRIQKDIKNGLFFINSDPPLILNGKYGCKDKVLLPSFCKCVDI